MQLLDGKKTAEDIKNEIAAEVQKMKDFEVKKKVEEEKSFAQVVRHSF